MSNQPFLELPLPLYPPEEPDYPRAKENNPFLEEEEKEERVIVIQL